MVSEAIKLQQEQAKKGWFGVFLSPLVQKLVLVTTMPILVGLALLATLMLFQYEQIIRDTIEQRYILFASEIKTRSEQWLKAGLLPENIPNMQGILESIEEDIDEEFSIDIINDQGVIIYSLDPSRLQDVVKSSTLRDLNFFIEDNGGEEYLIYNDKQQRSVVAPMFDNYGNLASAAIVSFPQSAYLDIISETVYKVVYYLIAIAIAITLIALILGGIILRKPVQWLWYLNQRFAYLNASKDPASSKDLSGFEVALTNNLRDMDKSATELQSIDSGDGKE